MAHCRRCHSARRGVHRRRVHADRRGERCRSSTSASCARTRPTTSSRSGTGKFFRLDKHLDRFFAGLEKLRLDTPGRPRRPHARARRVRAPCGHRGRRVRRGDRDAGHARSRARATSACASTALLLRDPVRLAAHAGAARARPAPRRRRDRAHLEPAVDPRIKNYHWLDFEQALLSAYDAGGDNVVLLGRQGPRHRGRGLQRLRRARRRAAGRRRRTCSRASRGITVLDIARELGLPCRGRRGHRRRPARRGRGVRREHGRRRLLRHLGRRRAAAATAASGPSRSASTTRTGPGTTTRASRSRSTRRAAAPA